MGKSTLLLQALGRMAGAGRALPARHRRGVERAGAAAGRAARRARARPARRGRDVAAARARARRGGRGPTCSRSTRSRPSLDPDLPGAPGSVTQVRDCAYRLVQQAKERELATVLVGHVTKEGTLAGPRVLEHVVDTVLSFDGDRGHALRLLHALKHRFGGTHELGLFEMTERGPRRRARRVGAVPRRPARRRCRARRSPRCSRARARCSSRCRRSSCPTGAPMPRRSAAGVDRRRLAMLLAVLEQHGGRRRSASADVYASVAGGLRVTETGARPRGRARGRRRGDDRRRSRATRSRSARSASAARCASVPQLDRRLAEAARLGFTRAVVPTALPRAPASRARSCVDGRRRCGTRSRAALIPRRAERRRRTATACGILVACAASPSTERKSPSCPPHRDRKR